MLRVWLRDIPGYPIQFREKRSCVPPLLPPQLHMLTCKQQWDPVWLSGAISSYLGQCPHILEWHKILLLTLESPNAQRLTLPYVVHPNGHSEEFWFGPDMSIELYLLVNTLSIKGWNYRNCFQLVHYVAIPITPTPLTQRKNGLQGENPSPLQRIASNEANCLLYAVPPVQATIQGPAGRNFPEQWGSGQSQRPKIKRSACSSG